MKNVTIAVLVVALAATAVTLVVRAQPSSVDFEVRVSARERNDGRIEVALQQRTGGSGKTGFCRLHGWFHPNASAMRGTTPRRSCSRWPRLHHQWERWGKPAATKHHPRQRIARQATTAYPARVQV